MTRAGLQRRCSCCAWRAVARRSSSPTGDDGDEQRARRVRSRALDRHCAPRCSRAPRWRPRAWAVSSTWSAGFERRSGRSTAAVERYDLRRDRWRRVRSMPVALNHPAAAAYRGDVYVLGGYTGRGDLRGEVASLYRYDPGARPVVPAARRADPPRRAGGGRRSARSSTRPAAPTRATARCDDSRSTTSPPADGRAAPTWASRASTSRARSRAARSTCSPGARPGGATSRSPSATCPRERRWERLPDMEKPRGGIGAAAVGGRVVVVGGEEQSGHDPRGRGATTPPAAAGPRLPDLRTPRHGLGVVSRRGRVYAIEGGPEPGFILRDRSKRSTREK